MNEISAGDALKLSIPERIILVEEIWDTMGAFPFSRCRNINKIVDFF